MNTEKKYEELKKKHSLPEFKELDNDFEISDIDNNNFILRSIIRRMADRIDYYTSLLEEVLHPDTGRIHSMHETRFFGDIEKKHMFDLYKSLMSFNRLAIEIALKPSEEDEAAFIDGFYTEWKSMRVQLLSYVKQMRASWRIETDIKEELGLGYLG